MNGPSAPGKPELEHIQGPAQVSKLTDKKTSKVHDLFTKLIRKCKEKFSKTTAETSADRIIGSPSPASTSPAPGPNVARSISAVQQSGGMPTGIVSKEGKAIYKMVQYIRKHGTKQEGILRLSGDKNKAEKLTKYLIKNPKKGMIKEQGTEVNDLVTGLKSILSGYALIDGDAKKHYLAAAANPDLQKQELQNMLNCMPPEKKELLHEIVILASEIAEHKETNKMPIENIGKTIGLSLISQDQDLQVVMQNLQKYQNAFELLVANKDTLQW